METRIAKRHIDGSAIQAILSGIQKVLSIITGILADLGRAAARTVTDPRLTPAIFMLIISGMGKARILLEKMRKEHSSDDFFEDPGSMGFKGKVSKLAKKISSVFKKKKKTSSVKAKSAGASSSSGSTASKPAFQKENGPKALGNDLKFSENLAKLKEYQERVEAQFKDVLYEYDSDKKMLQKQEYDLLDDKERMIREAILSMSISDDLKAKYTKELFRLMSPFTKELRDSVDSFTKIKNSLSKEKTGMSSKGKDFREIRVSLEKMLADGVLKAQKNMKAAEKKIDKKIGDTLKAAEKESKELERKAKKIIEQSKKIEKEAEKAKKKLEKGRNTPSVGKAIGEAAKAIAGEVGKAAAKEAVGSVVGALGASNKKKAKSLPGSKQRSLPFGDANVLKRRLKEMRHAGF